MECFDECLNYFKSNIGFTRFMEKTKSKYESLGKISGTIVINNPTNMERQALSGFMKKDYSRNKSISIDLVRFSKRLNETRFSGIDFKHILSEYFGSELVSKREIKEDYETTKSKDFSEILNAHISKKSYEYIYSLLVDKKGMYKRVIELYNNDKRYFFEVINMVCLAVDNLPKTSQKLSIFSANITKNPHYFDYDRIAGKLLIDALTYICNFPKSNNTESISQILYMNNILIDDVSNMVLCKNLIGYTSNKQIHPIWESMCKTNESLQITLSNLSNVSRVKAYNDFVLVVENPNVFTSLESMLDTKRVSLVCTYGQIKLSAIYLLDMLVKENTYIYYSGDIDPEGLIIADKLKQRYGDNIDLIYFDEKTYVNNISNELLSDKRIKKLQCINSEELFEIKELLLKHKLAAYEELNLKELYNFLINK